METASTPARHVRRGRALSWASLALAVTAAVFYLGAELLPGATSLPGAVVLGGTAALLIGSAILGLFALFGGESWLAIALAPAVLIFDVLALIPVLLLGGPILFG